MGLVLKIYKYFRDYMPLTFRKPIEKIGIMVFKRKLLRPYEWYKYSDEYLKFVHLLEAVNYLRVAGVGGKILPQTYFEFGCHSGRTFSAAIGASQLFQMDNMKFYAFDSFEGLPNTSDQQDGVFEAGTFSTSRDKFISIVNNNTGVILPDSNVIQGFYCDSLTQKLQDNMPKAGVVHIDVDLYSSTVDVLRFIKPLLVPGTLLVFDDWFCFPGGKLLGERKALTEFLEINSDIKVEEWKAYSTFGKSFFVTSI